MWSKWILISVLTIGVAFISLYASIENELENSKNNTCSLVQGYSDNDCSSIEVWGQLKEHACGASQMSLGSLSISSRSGSDKIVENFWNVGFVPLSRDVEPWPINLPIEWDADPYSDRNWRYQLHA